MITGDHLSTAHAIATRIEIETEGAFQEMTSRKCPIST